MHRAAGQVCAPILRSIDIGDQIKFDLSDGIEIYSRLIETISRSLKMYYLTSSQVRFQFDRETLLDLTMMPGHLPTVQSYVWSEGHADILSLRLKMPNMTTTWTQHVPVNRKQARIFIWALIRPAAKGAKSMDAKEICLVLHHPSSASTFTSTNGNR